MSCMYTVYMCLMYKLLTWVASKSISYIALITFTGEASDCVVAHGITTTWEIVTLI